MSSGFSGLAGRLLHPRRRVARRIAALAGAGRTTELDAVPAGTRVVEIDLGFGPECWTAPPGPIEITEHRAIARGALILAAGHRAGPRLLHDRGLTPERVPTRR